MAKRVAPKRAAQRGLTLIELLITITIIAGLVAIVVPSVNAITGANLKAAASQLGGTIRYSYDLAARKSAAFRLVFDLDEHAYWVESASEKFLLDRQKDEVREGAVDETRKEDRKPKRFVSRSDIESGNMWQPKESTSFASFAGPVTRKVPLPQDITFQGVCVAHQAERSTAGKSYLYFFPTGMTERATIHITDDSKDVFTLQVEPLTGGVKIFSKFVECPED